MLLRKFVLHPIAWCGAATLLLCSVSVAAADSPEQAAEQQETKLNRIKGRISTLRTDLKKEQVERDQLTIRLRESESEIGSSARRLKKIGDRLRKTQGRLDKLEAEQSKHRKAMQLQRRVLVRQLRSAYAMGRQQRLKILLNQEDPAIVSRLMVYYDYLNDARVAELERIKGLVAAVEQGKAQIAQERQRLLQLQSTELVERGRLEATRQQRQQVVDALTQGVQDKRRRLEQLLQDREQLKKVVEKLQKQIFSMPLTEAENKPFKDLKGKLRWPLKGAVSAGFGSSRGGGLKLDGVVIKASEGDEIHAIHRGRIAFADWLRGFGLLLIVDHGDGYMSLYGHNQSLFRETGEWVEAGDVVASVGRSGGRSDAGTYFGIRIKGRPVNPRRWCRRS